MRRWNHEGSGSHGLENSDSGRIRAGSCCHGGSSIKRVGNWKYARKHTHSTARAQYERRQWPIGSGGNKSKFFHALSAAGSGNDTRGRRFAGASQTGEFRHDSSGKQWTIASLPDGLQRNFRQQEEGQKG
jgi:hypothetical protein